MHSYRALRLVSLVTLTACASSTATRPAAVHSAADCVEKEPDGPRTNRPRQATMREDIEELLKVMQFDAIMNVMMLQTTAAMRSSYPELPDRFFEIMQANFTSSFVREFAIPLYEKHLTQDEIVALVEFYSRPVGQSILSKMPPLMTESMQQGADWGRLFGEREANRWRAEHKQEQR